MTGEMLEAKLVRLTMPQVDEAVPNPQAALLATLEQQRSALPVAGELALTPLRNHAYRLEHAGGFLFVKWLADDDRYSANEIRVNQIGLTRGDIVVPRLVSVLQDSGGSIAIWEWLPGQDLRGEHRHRLPEAFAELGRFHTRRRHDGPVVSPTTLLHYPSLAAMLAAEVDHLCTPHPPELRGHCAAALSSLLPLGYATFIHGDLHPGNVMLTPRGLVFTDWGYAIPSLNLFDLEYVHSIELGYDFWAYMCPPESLPLLDAYFASSGLAPADGRRAHLAVMLWSELRMHSSFVETRRVEKVARSSANIGLLLEEIGGRG